MKRRPTDIVSILRYALCLLALLAVILLPELPSHKAPSRGTDMASSDITHMIRQAHHRS